MRNQKAEGMILKTTDDTEITLLGPYTSARDLWEKIAINHKDENSGIVGYYIFAKLVRSMYTEGTDMREHVKLLHSQNDLLTPSGSIPKFSENVMGYVLISSITPGNPQWETIITSILHGVTPSTPLNFKTVSERFIQEYDQRTLRSSSSNVNALATTTKKPVSTTKPVCTHCNRIGHMETACYRLVGYPLGHKLAKDKIQR
jgi:hypothetical protein